MRKRPVSRFIGTVWDMDWEVEVHYHDHGIEQLPPRNDLANHSPDGFAWGYSGSGPAQLSVAILAALVEDEVALRYYMDFKDAFVSRFTKDRDFHLPAWRVMQWVREQREKE